MRLGPVDTLIVRKVIDGIVSSAHPLRAMRALVVRGSAPQAEPFERYAALELRAAGADRLQELAASYAVQINPPGEGFLARFAFKGDPTESERELLTDIEDAFNRLICIADAIEDAAMNHSPLKRANVSITFRGVDQVPKQAAYRSSQIELPSLGIAERPTAGYFNEIDWRMLDNVAGIGRAVFQGSVKPNLKQSVLGAYALSGSDWDVRTRLAATLDHMELALRFSCRFDCDIERQTVMVAFSAPPLASFPHWIASDGLDELSPARERLQEARDVYTIRLACLMACACFGAGRHVQNAYITAEAHDGSFLFSCAFERNGFVKTVLAAIDAGKLSNPSLRFDSNGLTAMLETRWFESASGQSFGTKPRDFNSTPNRIEPNQDTRVLTAELAAMFGARRVSDLDTHSYYGGSADLIETAKIDSSDSVIAAIANLESVIDELEEMTTAPEDDANARALYCGNPFSRIATPLLLDELSVGRHAQEFLDTDGNEDGDRQTATSADHRSEGGYQDDAPGIRFFRAPNALFNAHMGLSDLYQRMGDFSGAIAHADYCIALAPTTAGAYFRKADILAQQTRSAEAANVLIAGLRCAISKRDCALLYYHLALLLWRMGRKSDACAIQVYASSLEGEFAQKARAVVTSLRKRPDSAVIIHASPLAAAHEMARARIPVAPSDEARALIAHATIGLANSNAPVAAAPYAEALARYLLHDRVIFAACRSLQYGIGAMPPIAAE